MHIEDTAPAKVAIHYGGTGEGDVDLQEVNSRNEDDFQADADPEQDLPSANDDWFEGSAIRNAEFTSRHDDTPGGPDSDGPIVTADFVETTINDALTRIQDEVIEKDPFSDPSAYAGIEPEVPPMVLEEDKDWDAFFDEWEFFHDQETPTDLNPESL